LKQPLRVLALLDDTVVSGKVKPVLTFARSARDDAASPLEVSLLTFSRAGEDVDLVTSVRAEGFPIEVVAERRRFDFSVFPQLRSIVERRRPHVLWTHGAKTHFLVRAAGLHHDRAWVASHHGYTATSLTWTLYDQLDRWSLLGADRVITACDAFAADLQRRLRIRPERLRVARSPIVPGTLTAKRATAEGLREELGLRPETRVVLSVGRLSKEKGHATLIRAMAELPPMSSDQVRLIIVGDGPERAPLISHCARLDLSGIVRFVGYRRDVAPYYAIADVFVLPSFSEGSPNVLLEAMDGGVPIVATAVGGIPEMIHDREQGLLVPAGDAPAIARAIAALLNDAELGKTLGAAARQTLPAYTPPHYYAAVRASFEEAAAAAAVRSPNAFAGG
jgi:glycosyltransferase involved in cell wall biosynthesis